MRRFAPYLTARNLRIAWIIFTLVALAAAAGAPPGYQGGGG
ncbi:MAG: hypothetical protein WCD51_10625 [Anaerolineae bacterium]|jgi:hypothetical protein